MPLFSGEKGKLGLSIKYGMMLKILKRFDAFGNNFYAPPK